MRNTISLKKIGTMRIEFGTLGTLYYISRQKGLTTKARVRLFHERSAAVEYGRQLAARLSNPTKVLAEVKHYGKIIKSGEMYFVKLNRRDYYHQPVKGFYDRQSAFDYFLAQRTLSTQEMDAELRVAETYRFKAA